MFKTKHKHCTVPGCHRKHEARGYCCGHYQRLRKHGSVMASKPLRHWGLTGYTDDEPRDGQINQ